MARGGRNEPLPRRLPELVCGGGGVKPLCIDLFSGLGGWSDGFLAEGWDCIGFDIERHDYGTGGYPGQLVLQDVLTIHGSQFRNAACIVASPPCQEFSYMAMPWSRGKQIAAALSEDRDENGTLIEFPEGYTGSRTIEELTALFDSCFRIQREASEAAGHHIPLVVENVKGAQPWVGRAKANYGSFFLWGDVCSVGGRIMAAHQVQFGAAGVKAGHAPKIGTGDSYQRLDRPHLTNPAEQSGRKVPGLNFHEHEKTGKPGRSFQSAAVAAIEANEVESRKSTGGSWFGAYADRAKNSSHTSSSGIARKAASAQIAKIPFDLSSYIARAFKPATQERVA
jgi:hypothetical protein